MVFSFNEFANILHRIVVVSEQILFETVSMLAYKVGTI